MRTVLDFMWKLWLVTVFFILFAILLPALYFSLFVVRSLRAALAIQRFWGSAILLLGGIPFTTVWHFKPERGKAYVVCCNHSSYLDIILPFCFWPFHFHFLAKKEHAEAPFFGLLFRTMHIPIDRDNGIKASRALERAEADLKEGISIFVFPEGTISPSAPNMLPFKNGAFKLAIDAQVAIIPVTFANNWRIMPDYRKSDRLGTLGLARIIVHKPIETAGMTDDNINALRTNVYQTIEQGLKR